MDSKKILFVCLGNICRSPSAEAVMRSVVLNNRGAVEIDSAGIIGVHAGEPADSRMQKHAKKRGYILESISRSVDANFDFDYFDMIIGMDDQNISDLNALARSEQDKKKIYRMTSFCSRYTGGFVPDPYYGGDAGFELVLDILEDACSGLFNHIISDK